MPRKSDKPDLTEAAQAIFALAQHRMEYRTKEIYSFCTGTMRDQTRIRVELARRDDGIWRVKYLRIGCENGKSRVAGQVTVSRMLTARRIAAALGRVRDLLLAVSPDDEYLHTVKRPVLDAALVELDPQMAREVIALLGAPAAVK